MFRYRLHSPGGDDLGEATYAELISWATRSTSRRHAVPRHRRCAVRRGRRVAFVGLLQVEAA